jgi:hypothetical protein
MYFIISPPVDEPSVRVVIGDYIGQLYCEESFRKRHNLTRLLLLLMYFEGGNISILVTINK